MRFKKALSKFGKTLKSTTLLKPNYLLVTGVKRYLFWLGKPAVVRQDEITALKTMQDQAYKSLSVEHLKVGSNINLKEFGFQQEKGTVKYVSGTQCWVVLHSLGYVIKLQI